MAGLTVVSIVNSVYTCFYRFVVSWIRCLMIIINYFCAIYESSKKSPDPGAEQGLERVAVTKIPPRHFPHHTWVMPRKMRKWVESAHHWTPSSPHEQTPLLLYATSTNPHRITLIYVHYFNLFTQSLSSQLHLYPKHF